MPVNHWVPPPLGKLKLTNDATLDLNGGFIGSNIAIQDSAGKVIIAASIRKAGTLSICVAEFFIKKL